MPFGEDERRAVLAAHGATEGQVAALLGYTALAFTAPPSSLPLSDEPCVAVWEEYAVEAAIRGRTIFESLRERLVELRFPGLELECPQALTLLFHPTAAGRIPVLIAQSRADFETLVRALTKRNAPVPIPASQGACMVSGYTNQDRVARLRAAGVPLGADKSAYQDRFILLSTGPYSGTPASAIGLDDDAWVELSLTIRLEHECAHYVTRRALGAMRHSLHDELIADYAGLVAATGAFRRNWFLRFLGLDTYPACRPDGRLANYRGRPPLDDAALQVIASLVLAAASAVELFDAERLTHGETRPCDIARAILAIASCSLEELATPDAVPRLRASMAVLPRW